MKKTVEIINKNEINLTKESFNKATVTTCGNVIEVKNTTAKSQCQIKNLDKHTYALIKTGEIKNKKQNVKRIDNMRTIKKSQQQLRHLINSNMTEPERAIWTLTYAENMRNTKQAYDDFRKFIKRLRYRHGKKIEYIAAIEPQERGAWHFHVLLFFPEKAPFIENDTMEQIWGNGFTKTKDVNEDCDNFGAYLSAYLSNAEMTDAESKEKKYVKGSRLHFYPIGMKLFRCSKGIKSPIIEKMEENKLAELVASKNLEQTFERCYRIRFEKETNDVDHDIFIIYRCFKKLKIYEQKLLAL